MFFFHFGLFNRKSYISFYVNIIQRHMSKINKNIWYYDNGMLMRGTSLHIFTCIFFLIEIYSYKSITFYKLRKIP